MAEGSGVGVVVGDLTLLRSTSIPGLVAPTSYLHAAVVRRQQAISRIPSLLDFQLVQRAARSALGDEWLASAAQDGVAG
ncbi:MAG: hypothetical protein KAR22_14505, partial [Gammaproteobacteria bacterium]|nr:hypothetical protein [Gammaproteobacteria bacterium]